MSSLWHLIWHWHWPVWKFSGGVTRVFSEWSTRPVYTYHRYYCQVSGCVSRPKNVKQ